MVLTPSENSVTDNPNIWVGNPWAAPSAIPGMITQPTILSPGLQMNPGGMIMQPTILSPGLPIRTESGCGCGGSSGDSNLTSSSNGSQPPPTTNRSLFNEWGFTILSSDLSGKPTPKKTTMSWYELKREKPSDPRDLIANASLYDGVNNDKGIFLKSSTFVNPPIDWIESPITYGGIAKCQALQSDNFQMVADANRWNASHLTVNLDPKLAPPFRKLIFLRAGAQWEMQIPLNLGRANYNDLQLSYRDNAATNGIFTADASGMIPVVSFTARTYTGNVILKISLSNRQVSLYYKVSTSLMLRAIDTAGNWSAFEMLLKIVL